MAEYAVKYFRLDTLSWHVSAARWDHAEGDDGAQAAADRANDHSANAHAFVIRTA